jgi:two-component system, OmpR family, sensor kinase
VPAVNNLRLSVLLSILAAILLAGALSSVGLTYWAINRTGELERRAGLAHASYDQYQDLNKNIYHLFKEHADELLIGNLDRSVTEKLILDKIAANVASIREIIGREIEIEGEEEIGELHELSTLNAEILRILEHYGGHLGKDGIPASTSHRELVQLLDVDIDQTLSALIEEALDHEKVEVDAALLEATEFRTWIEKVANVIVGVMVVAMIVVAMIYYRKVSLPLRDLVRGAKAYRSGDYEVQIPIAGAAEFRQLSGTMSEMAAEIGRRERTLRDDARVLEAQVSERTAELQIILARFEQVEASRRQMMADVSHELRTPLTIIQGEADIALRNGAPKPDVAVETFSRIRDAARHSNRIVDDLLLVAREEAGQLRLDLRNIDLDSALADAAEMAQSRVEVQRLGMSAIARVDPVRLRQCILAVINNAGRYGGRSIQAWVEREGDGYEIHIEDDGPGMSDAEKAQAFERFFRGSGAQSIGVEGTGLGLPIVRSIMNAHGGSVELRDRDGGGLKVVLRFPRVLRVMPSLRDAGSRESA